MCAFKYMHFRTCAFKCMHFGAVIIFNSENMTENGHTYFRSGRSPNIICIMFKLCAPDIQHHFWQSSWRGYQLTYPSP